jgi:muramoyltetrapeptide carboxypeptidase
MVPLTLRAGLPTLHGDNLADTPYAVPAGLAHWTDLVSSNGNLEQSGSGLIATWRPLEESEATEWKEAGRGRWRLHGPNALDVTGTLIGGCIELMAGIAGTTYGDVRAFGDEHGDLVVYLEASEENAFNICRYLHHIRYAGWFHHAAAVLIGRTNAPASADDGGLTQDEAVLDAIGGLDCPIVFDVENRPCPAASPAAQWRICACRGRRRPARDHSDLEAGHVSTAVAGRVGLHIERR